MILYYWQVTFALMLLIIFTRSLPFLFARFMTSNFNETGKLLPAYIMLLLIIRGLDLNTLKYPPYGIPAFIALAVTTAIHLWQRNTLISLIMGTGCYILLLATFFK